MLPVALLTPRRGLASARTLSLLALLTLVGCTAPRPAPEPPLALHRYQFTQPQMGMPFRIIVYAENENRATRAAEAAYARVAQLNNVLSDYEDDSELTLLSKTSGSGQAVRLSDDLWHVLDAAQRLSARSGGAFDVTVGPCVNLWRRARRQRELPEPARLEAARRAVGFRNLHLDARSQTATLQVPHMRLDLGGIAKGYALDAALQVLDAQGLSRALITCGGDMAAGDPPPGQPGWRIEIAPLDLTNAPPPHFVWLVRRGLATSGDLFQRLEIGGKRYSHIVDPRTGIGLTDHSLVTIIAPNAMTADSLATAVSVLGPKAGLALVEATPKVAALVVRRPAETIERFESRRFRRLPSASPELDPGAGRASREKPGS